MDEHSVIIDCFWTHNSIAYLSKLNNVLPIHLYSSEDVRKNNLGSNTVAQEYFIDNLTYNNNLPELLQYLQKFNIKFIYGCSDSGQRLANEISVYLNLSTKNIHELARYNKFHLYKLLNQDAAQNNFKNFVELYNKCIIKPAPIEMSSGCSDVKLVDNTTTVIEDKLDFFISPFFEGTEYAIDFVTFNGKHKLAGVWKYVNNNHTDWWKDKVVLLDYTSNSTLISKMYTAATNWLNIIGHKHGPTHIELRFNGKDFFCVEINFRLHGHMPIIALRKGLIDTQPDLTINCLLGKEVSNDKLDEYNNIGFVSRLYYINQKFRLESTIPWHDIEKVSSFQRIWKHASKGAELVPVTEKSTRSCLAIVVLANKDQECLNNDEKRVLSLLG